MTAAEDLDGRGVGLTSGVAVYVSALVLAVAWGLAIVVAWVLWYAVAGLMWISARLGARAGAQ